MTALPEFEGLTVDHATVRITNAGDGLSEALDIAPKALGIDDDVELERARAERDGQLMLQAEAEAEERERADAASTGIARNTQSKG